MKRKLKFYIAKPIWFAIKICIYLLVTWSILFSLAVPAGIYYGYLQWQNFNATIAHLKSTLPQSSAFMDLRSQSQECKEGIDQVFVSLDSISINLQKTVVAVEDAAFFTHPGIHLESILEAMEANAKRGKKKFGGSTLTQQLAKNLFLSQERSYERKIKELVYTLLLEKHLEKERILELYLNYAQFGPCQFGCEAGARYFYHKSCKNLNFSESVNLATILASPEKYHPENQKSKLLGARRSVIYNNLYGTGFLKRDSSESDSTSNLENGIGEKSQDLVQPIPGL